MKVTFKLMLFALVLAASSCVKDDLGEVVQTDRIGLGYFDKLKVLDGIQVEVVRGSQNGVIVEAPDGFQDDIYTEVNGLGVLTISISQSINPQDIAHKKVFVTMPALSSITAWDGSEVYTSGTFSAPKFRIDADNNSYVDTDIDTGELSVIATAGSEVKAYGVADALYIDKLSGNSIFYGYSLRTQLSDLTLSGRSEAQVTAISKLVVTASEASIVKYAGHPNIVYSLPGGSQLIDAN
jgi:hypothetical protein